MLLSTSKRIGKGNHETCRHCGERNASTEIVVNLRIFWISTKFFLYNALHLFFSLITGRGVTPNRRSAIMATIHDRLRIPWRGGAKQIAPDCILPIILIPITLIHAALSFWRTIISFTLLLIFFLLFSCHLIRTVPKTKFFYVWMITSLVFLYAIFEFIVIPFLQILVEENIALSVLIGGFLLCLYLTRGRNRVLEDYGMDSGVNRMHHCSICRVSVPDRDHHCVW